MQLNVSSQPLKNISPDSTHASNQQAGSRNQKAKSPKPHRDKPQRCTTITTDQQRPIEQTIKCRTNPRFTIHQNEPSLSQPQTLFPQATWPTWPMDHVAGNPPTIQYPPDPKKPTQLYSTRRKEEKEPRHYKRPTSAQKKRGGEGWQMKKEEKKKTQTARCRSRRRGEEEKQRKRTGKKMDSTDSSHARHRSKLWTLSRQWVRGSWGSKHSFTSKST